jgi:ATP-dependent exoDNAse (exonuclease V) alpha subunit
MDNNLTHTSKRIQSHFPFEPTDDQLELMGVLAEFLHSKEENSLMLLKGFAGTGKTSIIAALVEMFSAVKYKTVLLAPTGRAAKVMSKYSKHLASTIHKKVYFTDVQDGVFQFKMQKNMHRNTFFIVDEASMISDQSSGVGNDYYQSRRLLEDLFRYVYSGVNCRMILVGDSAQLPPVGLERGEALDGEYMRVNFNASVFEFELQEVVRQAVDSGILMNATAIREKIRAGNVDMPFFNVDAFSDFNRINGEELEELLNDTFLKNVEESILITRSNKRANLFNKEIRNRVLYRDEVLSCSDLLMVVRNNYFWLPKDSKAGFIANGDIIEVLNILSIEDMYGFSFADVRVRLVDYDEEKDFEVKVLLDTLDIDSANLDYKRQRELYFAISQDYQDVPSRYVRHQKVVNSAYFNALQVKFSYAITCHKAQGGQWDYVFVDQGFLPKDGIDLEYLKWLYTAVTRSKKGVFLVDFTEEMFYASEK